VNEIAIFASEFRNTLAVSAPTRVVVRRKAGRGLVITHRREWRVMTVHDSYQKTARLARLVRPRYTESKRKPRSLKPGLQVGDLRSDLEGK